MPVKCKCSRGFWVASPCSTIYTQLGFHRASHSPPETGASTPQGGGGGYKFLHFVIYFLVSIHPLRFARPPVSGGQFAGVVVGSKFSTGIVGGGDIIKLACHSGHANDIM